MTLQQFCFSFTGRINRALYWKYVIVSILIVLFAVIVINATDGAMGAIVVVMAIKVIFIDLAVAVKRLHDTNRSGWHILTNLIPIVGTIYLFVVCGCLKGTDGDNNYGPPVNKIT